MGKKDKSAVKPVIDKVVKATPTPSAVVASEKVCVFHYHSFHSPHQHMQKNKKSKKAAPPPPPVKSSSSEEDSDSDSDDPPPQKTNGAVNPSPLCSSFSPD